MSDDKTAYLKELSDCLFWLSSTVHGISSWDILEIKKCDVAWGRYDYVIDLFEGEGNPSYFVRLGELLEAGKPFLPCEIIEEAGTLYTAIDQIYDEQAFHIERAEDIREELTSKTLDKKSRRGLEKLADMHCESVLRFVVSMLGGLCTPLLLLSSKAKNEIGKAPGAEPQTPQIPVLTDLTPTQNRVLSVFMEAIMALKIKPQKHGAIKAAYEWLSEDKQFCDEYGPKGMTYDSFKGHVRQARKAQEKSKVVPGFSVLTQMNHAYTNNSE